MCDLFSWKDRKKTGIILAAANMFFVLVIFFNYSVFALALLFLFFVSLLGMGLNLVYRATSNEVQSQR